MHSLYLQMAAVIHLAVQRGEVAPGPQPRKPVSLHANCRLCKVEVRRTGQLDDILLPKVGEPHWQASNEANLRRNKRMVCENILQWNALCSETTLTSSATVLNGKCEWFLADCRVFPSANTRSANVSLELRLTRRPTSIECQRDTFINNWISEGHIYQ